jgi:lysophospholipase L1-like esterase
MRALLLLLAAVLTTAPAAAEPTGTIVAFGDSITKGMVRTPWPDVLRQRLQARFPKTAIRVVNAGIGGNQLLGGAPGMPAGVARFARDALGPKDVRIVILLEGINDIGGIDLAQAKDGPDAAKHDLAAEIIAGYQTLIAQAHARGVKLYGGTLTPFEGTSLKGYYSPAGETIRQKVNHWIRTAGAFDGVIDFDAALRDPKDPPRLRPDYDSGDHLHPNAAGEAAMADAIDLSRVE